MVIEVDEKYGLWIKNKKYQVPDVRGGSYTLAHRVHRGTVTVKLSQSLFTKSNYFRHEETL